MMKLLKLAAGLALVFAIFATLRVDFDHIGVIRCALAVFLIFLYGSLREKGWVR